MTARIFPIMLGCTLITCGLILGPARTIQADRLAEAVGVFNQPAPEAAAADAINDDNEYFWSPLAYDPTWYFAADALLLDRRNPTGSVLFVNTVDPAQNLNAADFKFNYQGGLELSARHRIGENWLEVRYFGIDQWSANTATATTPGDLLQINAAVPVFTFTGDRIVGSYSSELHNVESNLRRRVGDRLQLLAGFRCLELDERLDAALVNSAVPFALNTSTRNRLYGGQIGAQVTFWNWEERLFIGAEGKAGVYNNSAAQGSQFSTGVVTLPAAGTGSRTTFVGEVGMTVVFGITDRLSIRGGYRLLWLDGVALASDQLAASDFAAATGFNNSGEAIFHGASCGLQYVW